MSERETASAPKQGYGTKTTVFAVILLAILMLFLKLGSLPGPPDLPTTPAHQGLTKDPQCLACHHWPALLPPGTTVSHPLGENHPPARPKKKRAVATDAGVAFSTVTEFECIKCHRFSAPPPPKAVRLAPTPKDVPSQPDAGPIVAGASDGGVDNTPAADDTDTPAEADETAADGGAATDHPG